jgi:hypothetical protein
LRTKLKSPDRAEECREAEAEGEAPAEIRKRAVTRFVGLLFLLGPAGELGLPDEILNRFPRRPFVWAMHQLALALVPAAEDDPAVLAFSGLLPDARPPATLEAPPSDAEREVLASFVAAIDARLAELLEIRHPIPFVCERQAEIVADPGWIEVRLSLRDVSTGIRRAGLDLDPGWIPWLGVVVRFVYE